MATPPEQPSEQPIVSNEKLGDNWPLIVAILYILGLFMLLPTIVGLIFAYSKKDEAEGSYGHSIYIYLIRTFWIALLLGFIGLITSFFGIGLLILLAEGIWYLVRVIKATVAAADKKPIAQPQTWLF